MYSILHFFITYFLSIDFVCNPEKSLTFLSSCHAGCTEAQNQSTFTNCECIEGNEVQSGVCVNEECNYVYLAVILFFQVLFTFMGTMPGLVAGLRSVIILSKSNDFKTNNKIFSGLWIRIKDLLPWDCKL